MTRLVTERLAVRDPLPSDMDRDFWQALDRLAAEAEKALVYSVHNETELQKGVMIRRGKAGTQK
jgi:hypothetical protein